MIASLKSVSLIIIIIIIIGSKSRTERPRKTKFGTEVGHVARDSDTTFNVTRSKVNFEGAGHIVAASRTACSFRDDSPCKTRICAAEMAVRYAALSACRKVNVCHCNSLGGAT